MRTALIACALVFWTLSVGYAMTDGQLKVIDSISGGSVLALRAALPEIDRVKLKLSEYRVTVAEDGSSIQLTCTDPAKGPEVRGGGGRMLGFTVELSKGDLRIIKSYYSRQRALKSATGARRGLSESRYVGAGIVFRRATRGPGEAEIAAADVRSWRELFNAYLDYSVCDVAAIGEGVSDSVGRRLSADMVRWSELAGYVRRDDRFLGFIVRRVDGSSLIRPSCT